MKNFEERKAEIFRRSEKRIQDRKRNRNRVLLCCTPLLLCMTLYSVMILPAMLPAGSPNDSAEIAPEHDADDFSGFPLKDESINSEEIFPEQTYNSFIRVEVQNEHDTHIHTEPEIVSAIAQAINNAVAKQQNSMADAEHSDADDETESQKTISYIVILTDVSGIQTTYRLTEDALIVLSTGTKYTLTADNVRELIEMLGIHAE